MFASKFVAALVASTLAGSVFAAHEVYVEAQVATESMEDGRSTPSMGGASLQPIGAVNALQGLEALFAHENLAVSDQTYATKTKTYMDTAFDNARNLRGLKNSDNGRYRDPGWWALLWTAAYDLTEEQKYVEEAEQLLDSMVGRWGDFCGQGSHCSKAHTYIKTSLSELALSLAQVTHRMSSGSWFSLGWAARRYDSVAPDVSSGQDKKELKARSLGGCAGGTTTPSGKQANVVGGIIELCQTNGTTLGEAHALAGAFLANITEKAGPDEKEFNIDGYEPQFKKVFVEKRQKLLQVLPNEKYQKLLERDLNRVSQQASADMYGSASWYCGSLPRLPAGGKKGFGLGFIGLSLSLYECSS